MTTDRIAGYTYQAAIHCPDCILDMFGTVLDTNAEQVLNSIAALLPEIDRMDEYSFDSDDFPKVIFTPYLNEDEVCETCENQLI